MIFIAVPAAPDSTGPPISKVRAKTLGSVTCAYNNPADTATAVDGRNEQVVVQLKNRYEGAADGAGVGTGDGAVGTGVGFTVGGAVAANVGLAEGVALLPVVEYGTIGL
jgi:hypothetical protein